jgi:hypothetical protein
VVVVELVDTAVVSPGRGMLLMSSILVLTGGRILVVAGDTYIYKSIPD